MNRKHKSAVAYTHTHTHTHTQVIHSMPCGASERGACNG